MEEFFKIVKELCKHLLPNPDLCLHDDRYEEIEGEDLKYHTKCSLETCPCFEKVEKKCQEPLD